MRQEIYESIENDDNPKAQLTKQNLIINGLIKEYLDYKNYLHYHLFSNPKQVNPKMPIIGIQFQKN